MPRPEPAPPPAPTRSPRPIRRLLVVGLALANLLVWAFSAYSLRQSRQRDEEAARVLTRNVTQAIDQSVAKTATRIDLALRAVVDELQRQLAGPGLDEARMNALLETQMQRVPEVGTLRVTRADGLLILGRGLNQQAPQGWGDRDFFDTLRQGPDTGLHIASPVVGRVSQRLVVPFLRRYHHPDGRFAGLVGAGVPIEQFTKLLEAFDVGPSGVLVLRDATLALVTRVPAQPHGPSGQVGTRIVSDDFRKVFDSGARSATGYTAVGTDGVPRVFTFHRMTDLPMVAIVAVSSRDYLQGWDEEVQRTLAMAGAFGLLSIFFGATLIGLLKRADADLQALEEKQRFVTSILDSLTEHVAVIDDQGTITAVNAAWRRFATDNGAPAPAPVAVGANYLQACAGAGSHARGDEALQGIRGVLDGSLSEFALEYPCHSPQQQRWFVLHGMPLVGHRRGAVLIHQNVTYRHEAEALLRASEEHFRLLAENMEDVVWKTDAQLVFTYINDADRRLRGYPQADVVGHHIDDTVTAQGRAILAHERQQRLEMELRGQTRQARHFELPQRRVGGGEVWVEVMSIPVYDAAGTVAGFQGICRDISQRKALQAELEQSRQALEVQLQAIASQHSELREKANRDPLTGAHNRRYLDEALPRELARAALGRYPVALIMVDLDHFKDINDSYSHLAGDAVLKALTQLLTRGARESDIVCRYGGEEFVLVMPRLSADLALPRMDALRLELQGLRIPHGDTEIAITFSAGIAVFPEHGTQMDMLIARADEMLYRAKREGRNRVRLYGSD